jgi:hypothetical protein
MGLQLGTARVALDLKKQRIWSMIKEEGEIILKGNVKPYRLKLLNKFLWCLVSFVATLTVNSISVTRNSLHTSVLGSVINFKFVNL